MADSESVTRTSKQDNVARVPSGESLANPMLALQNDMRRMFQNFFALPAYGMMQSDRLWGGMLQPKLDISETDKEIEISVELSGADEKDIEVAVENGMLTIRGEKRAASEDENKTFHRVERSYGAFERSLVLPEHVDEDRIKARFENGVLLITAPKKNGGSTRKKKVEVVAGK